MTAVAFAQPAAGQNRPPVTGIAGQIMTTVIDDVRHASANAPRSLQRAPGPSELGTPCTRRLAYKTLGQDPANTGTDHWAADIGTSVHAWMADLYEAKNQAARDWWTRCTPARDAEPPPDRYLVERRVHLPYAITGSSDLYDRETRTVIDWKLTGLDRIRKYRTSGPGQQYKVQAHLYGLGLQIAGEHPEHVAIVFLPRGGRIDGLHVWTEPYDPSAAVAALTRYDTTKQAVVSLDPELYPERWAMFPTADAYCTFCPFYLPYSADLGKGCPGHATVPPTESAVDSMIANHG